MPLSKSLIGQNDLKARLGKALEELPGHAFVFVGPQGIGKLSFAREFTKGLLCFNKAELGGCGQCPSCKYFEEGSHPDYKEVVLQKNDKTIKTDVIRKTICSDIFMLPQISNRKVYYVSADDLNEQSQNTLLKTLEETPEYAVIILGVSVATNLLPTILSRVVPFHFKRNTIPEVVRILSERGIEDTSSLKFFAKLSEGIPGFAISLSENEFLADQRDRMIDMLFKLKSATRSEILTDYYSFFDENKAHTDDLLIVVNTWIRDMMVYSACKSADRLINEDKADLIRKNCPTGDMVVSAFEKSGEIVQKAVRGLELNAGYENCICNMLIQMRKEISNV